MNPAIAAARDGNDEPPGDGGHQGVSAGVVGVLPEHLEAPGDPEHMFGNAGLELTGPTEDDLEEGTLRVPLP